MNALRRLLNEVPGPVLERVLEAVTDHVPLHEVWVSKGVGEDDCDGCFAVIVCHAAVGKEISLDLAGLPDDGTLEVVLGDMLGVYPDLIEAAWHYWDMSMSDRGRLRFINGLGVELQLLRKRKFEQQIATAVEAIPSAMLVRR